jgi:hypothetical protein
MEEKLVQRLTTEQVKACFEIAPSPVTRKALLSRLTEKQILDFDYSLLNQDYFDILFKPGLGFVGISEHLSEGDKVIPKLSKKQIEQLKGFFKEHHWKKLTDEQALEIDWDKFSTIEKAKEIFKWVYEPFKSYGMSLAHTEGTAKCRFEKQSIEKIMQLSKYFSDDHWFDLCHLNKEAIQKFTFAHLANTNETKEFFTALWKHGSKFYGRASGMNFFNHLTKAQSAMVMPLMPPEGQTYLRERRF